jgi:hypothetical protein
MLRSRSTGLTAGIIVILTTMHAAAEPMCKPALTVTAVRFSEMSQAQRQWTAELAVDASRCATASGRFAIEFLRLKENAPDLRFREPFTWTAGRTEVSTRFSADEAVLAYSIGDVAPCACRE